MSLGILARKVNGLVVFQWMNIFADKNWEGLQYFAMNYNSCIPIFLNPHFNKCLTAFKHTKNRGFFFISNRNLPRPVVATFKNCSWYRMLYIRGIRTNAKMRLLTKIDLNEMHLVNLCKKICQKLEILGSGDLQIPCYF